MSHLVKFAFLGFHFNSLVDEGEFLNLKETHKKIEQRSLFLWLREKYQNRVDLSLFSEEELNGLEDFFSGLSLGVNEGRKMGVSNNGLCLLVAYCFEGAQHKPENIE